MPNILLAVHASYLSKLSGQVISQKLLLLLIVHSQGFLLFLEGVYLLEQSVGDVLLFLFCLGLL